MYSYFKSEALKIKHTFVVKLAFIAPIFAILCALLLMPAYFEVNSYNWWYASILPGMLSLGCALVAVKDKKKILLKDLVWAVMIILQNPLDLENCVQGWLHILGENIEKNIIAL